MLQTGRGYFGALNIYKIVQLYYVILRTPLEGGGGGFEGMKGKRKTSYICGAKMGSRMKEFSDET